ncbi:hypothetical protein FWK45_02420 [Histophilus somni]|uniref:CdiI immunity protein domain-containing protein n=2 Tax=Histophilus somni TaxID=731 RepID=A0AAX2S4M0_HISSO|nr:hypothetical protein [Histophilus somni]QEH09310.1 hypothetical protein FWK43_07370 [Histophilus somni]QEH12033.1 hypothetical protein FWK44_02415 [Histophilus somni]QEH25587.1 hypothetical protein FWK61_07395 [Histophilus somni]QEH26511.1 hypothetical protein FWK62_02425 [Histophilus somni]QEH50705.1 hypothetical protein FWK45_02420 [Histophilus somni]
MYYDNNVSQNLADWEDILYHFNATIEDSEVWEVARSFKEIPHFGNIYQSLVIGRLESLFFEHIGLEESDERIKVFTFVNGLDSHFCINGEAINTLDEFMAKVEEIKSTLH